MTFAFHNPKLREIMLLVVQHERMLRERAPDQLIHASKKKLTKAILEDIRTKGITLALPEIPKWEIEALRHWAEGQP